MVLIGLIFVAAQVLSIILYVALAAYAASNQGRRAADWPFLAFCLSQAFDAATYLALNTPDPGDGLPAMLRLRAAIAMLAPAFFLHTAAGSLKGRHALIGVVAAAVAYTIGGTGALLVGLTDRIMLATASTGLPGAYVVRPVLSPAGHTYAWITAAITLAVTVPLLVHALWLGVSPRARSDARHILTPAALLMLSFVIRTPDVSLPAAPPIGLGLAAGVLQRALSLAAGLFLASSVLRFGSPVGVPVHHRLSPVALALGLSVIIAAPALLRPEVTSLPTSMITPVLIGLLAGVLIGRPETLRLADRLLGRRPPQQTRFSESLRSAWRALAADDGRPQDPAALRQALQRELMASYVEILQRAAGSAAAREWVFQADGLRVRVRVPHREQAWPLEGAALDAVEAEGLPAPPQLIVPIRRAADVLGLIVIGESERGGAYGRGEVMQVEALAELLSAAADRGAAADIQFSPGPGRRRPDAVPAPAIRAFGRLRISAPLDSSSGSRTVPLRSRQLLGLLLTAYPEPVSTEALLDRLWPEAAPRAAANSLYVAVHSLRRSLEPYLAAGAASRYVLHEGEAYRLHLDASIRVDVLDFESAYRRCRRVEGGHLAEPAARELRAALTLYRGPYLAETALHLSPQIEAVRHRLQLQCIEMARLLIRSLGLMGRWLEAKGVVLALRQADPEEGAFLELLGHVVAQRLPPPA